MNKQMKSAAVTGSFGFLTCARKLALVTMTCALTLGAWAADVCQIGTTAYSSLADALAAVNDGETIEILVPEIAMPNIQNGGAGKAFRVDGASGKTVVTSWDCGKTGEDKPRLDDITFANLTVTNQTISFFGCNTSFKDVVFTEGVMWGYVNGYAGGEGKGPVTFEGCEFQTLTQDYAIHFDEIHDSLLFRNCKVRGRLGLAAPSSPAYAITFEGCDFAGRSKAGTGKCNMNVYSDLTFRNCTFADDYCSGSARGILMLDAAGENPGTNLVASLFGCSLANPESAFALTDIFRRDYLGKGAIDATRNGEGKMTSGTLVATNEVAEAFVAPGCVKALKDKNVPDVWAVGSIVDTGDGTVNPAAFVEKPTTATADLTETPAETKIELDKEVTIGGRTTTAKAEIETKTDVEGVVLSTVGQAGGETGVQAVVDASKAKAVEKGNAEFTAEIVVATNVEVEIDVKVTPTEYVTPAAGVSGVAGFKLEPLATVKVMEGETAKASQDVPVTNEMLDPTAKITVSIFTGFEPKMIVHVDNAGEPIESFTGDKIKYDAQTGIAQVQVSHFSSLYAYQAAVVCRIGTTPYESINAAFAAAAAATGDVKIEILKNISEELTDDYTFTNDVTIAANAEGGAAVDLGFASGKTAYGLLADGSSTLAIDESVRITGLAQLFAGYGSGVGNTVNVAGDVTAQQIWTYKGGIVNVRPTAKVVAAYGDGMIKLRYDSTVNVEGTGTDEVQFAAGYFSGDKTGAKTLNLSNTYVTASWLRNEAEGSFTLNLTDAKFVLKGDAPGKLDFGKDAIGTIRMNGGSFIQLGSITNVNVIEVDMTGATASPIKLIDASLATDYGTEGVNYKFADGKDNGYYFEVRDNDLIVKKLVARIDDRKFDSVNAAIEAAQSGDYIELFAAGTIETNTTLGVGVRLDTAEGALTIPEDVTLSLIGSLNAYDEAFTNKGSLVINAGMAYTLDEETLFGANKKDGRGWIKTGSVVETAELIDGAWVRAYTVTSNSAITVNAPWSEGDEYYLELGASVTDNDKTAHAQDDVFAALHPAADDVRVVYDGAKYVATKTYKVTVDGIVATNALMNAELAFTAPVVDEKKGYTNIVCTGWTGSTNGTAVAALDPATTVAFKITADSVIDWHYRTNYFVKASLADGSAGTARISQTNGVDIAETVTELWLPKGAAYQMTATPADHYHFVKWAEFETGTAEEASKQFAAANDRPRHYRAEMPIDTFDITIDGKVATNIAYGATYTATAPIVNVTNAWTNIVCTGWTGMTNGVKDVSGPESGFTLNITTNSTFSWLYVTNWYLSVAAAPGRTTVTNITAESDLPLASFVADGSKVAAETVAVHTNAEESAWFECKGSWLNGADYQTGVKRTIDNLANPAWIAWNVETNYLWDARIVGGEQYLRLKDALAAAQDGETVELLRDAQVAGGEQHVTKSITLDLKGYAIVCTNAVAADDTAVLDIGTGWSGPSTLSVTLKDSVGGGKMTGGKNGYRGGCVLVRYGSFTFESGTIEGNAYYAGSGDTDAAASGGAIFVYQNATATVKDGARVIANLATRTAEGESHGGAFGVAGTLSIEGGLVSNNVAKTSAGFAYVLAGGKLTVTGGTIVDNKPGDKAQIVTVGSGSCSVQAGTFDFDPYDFVDAGSCTKKVGDYWQVVKAVAKVMSTGKRYETLAEAYAAASAGDTVKFIVSEFADSIAGIPAGVTLEGADGMTTVTKTLNQVAFTDVTFRNLKFAGTGSATSMCYSKGTGVTFDGCDFAPQGKYAVHFDGAEGTVMLTNCTVRGSVAMASTVYSRFVDCDFAGKNAAGYCNINFYTNAVFESCSFGADHTSGGSRGILSMGDSVIEMNDCTAEGAAVTSVARRDYLTLVAIDATKDENGKFDGGTIVANDQEIIDEKVAPEYAAAPVDETGVKVIVKGVCKIGNTRYETLQGGVDAAQAGETVLLFTNVTLTARVDVTNSIAIDLGGKTITREDGDYSGNGSAFNVCKDAGAVVITNGAINLANLTQTKQQAATAANECDAITVRSGAFVTLADVGITVDSISGACAYAFKGGTVTVASGAYTNLTEEPYPFNAVMSALVFNQANDDTEQAIVIEGGTFVGQDPNDGDDSGVVKTFLAPGKSTVWDFERQCYVVVSAVARIGTRAYGSLAAAVDAAKAGETVELLKDVTLAARVDATNDVSFTIDLGGKTVKPTATCANGSAFNVAKGTVTFANGTIDGTEIVDGEVSAGNKECDAITVRTGATANLTDTLTVLVKSQSGACAYAFKGGKVNVTGGSYKNTTTEPYPYKAGWKGLVFNQANDDTAQAIVISGGTFVGQDPLLGDDSGSAQTFLAPGMTTKWDGEKYVVVSAVAKIGTRGYETLKLAFGAVRNDEAIDLLKSTEGDVIVVAAHTLTNVTLDLGGFTYAVTAGGPAFDVTASELTFTNGSVSGSVKVSQSAKLLFAKGIAVTELLLGDGADEATVLKDASVELDAPYAYAWSDPAGDMQRLVKGVAKIGTDPTAAYYANLTNAVIAATNVETVILCANNAEDITLANVGDTFRLNANGFAYSGTVDTSAPNAAIFVEEFGGVTRYRVANVVTVTPQAVDHAELTKVETNQVAIASPYVVESNATVTVTYTASNGWFFAGGITTYTASFEAVADPALVPVSQLPAVEAAVAKIGTDRFFYTLPLALAAAQDGETVEMLRDAQVVGGEQKILKSITLDLKGFAIAVTNEAAMAPGAVITVGDGSAKPTVTLKDSVGTGKVTGGKNQWRGGGVWIWSGNFIFESGTIESNAYYAKFDESANACGGAIFVDSGATATMKEGACVIANTATTAEGEDARESHGGAFGVAGTLSIEGGLVSNNVAKTSAGFAYVLDGGKLNISGGTIVDNTVGGEKSFVGTVGTGGCAVTNGWFDVDPWEYVVPNRASVKVGDLWTIEDAVCKIGEHRYFSISNAIEAAASPDDLIELVADTDEQVVLTENGQYFKLATNGFTFSGEVTTTVEGAIVHVEPQQDCTIYRVMTAVAEINGRKFALLSDAAKAAQDGDTIALIRDCSTDGVTVTNDVTIALNGMKLTVADTLVNEGKITMANAVAGQGGLYVTGCINVMTNGFVDLRALAYGQGGLIPQQGGAINLYKDSTVKFMAAWDGQSANALKAYTAGFFGSLENGAKAITDKTYTWNAATQMFDVDGAVANAETVKLGKEFLDSFDAVAAAIDAVKPSGTVTIVANCAETSVLSIGKDLTLDIDGCEVTLAGVDVNASAALRNSKLGAGTAGSGWLKMTGKATIAAGATLDMSYMPMGQYWHGIHDESVTAGGFDIQAGGEVLFIADCGKYAYQGQSFVSPNFMAANTNGTFGQTFPVAGAKVSFVGGKTWISDGAIFTNADSQVKLALTDVARVGYEGTCDFVEAFDTPAVANAVAKDGDTLELIAAASADGVRVVKDITLDMDGQTLTVAEAFTNAANLVIKNTHASAGGLVANGRIVVESGTLDASALGIGEGGLVPGQSGGLDIAGGATFKIMSAWADVSPNWMAANRPAFLTGADGAKVEGTRTYTYSAAEQVWVVPGQVAKAEIVDGSLEYVETYDTLEAAMANVKANGLVTLLAGATTDGIDFADAATLDLHGQTLTNGTCTVSGTVTITNGVAAGGLFNAGTVTVSGMLDMSSLTWGAGGFIPGDKGALKITSQGTVKMGTTDGKSPNWMAANMPSFLSQCKTGATLVIGGTSYRKGKYGLWVIDDAVAKAEVVAKDVQGVERSYVETFVTLTNAVDAAKTNGTVTLLADCGTAVVDKAMTLSENGFEATNVCITAAGVLKITGVTISANRFRAQRPSFFGALEDGARATTDKTYVYMSVLDAFYEAGDGILATTYGEGGTYLERYRTFAEGLAAVATNGTVYVITNEVETEGFVVDRDMTIDLAAANMGGTTKLFVNSIGYDNAGIYVDKRTHNVTIRGGVVKNTVTTNANLRVIESYCQKLTLDGTVIDADGYAGPKADKSYGLMLNQGTTLITNTVIEADNVVRALAVQCYGAATSNVVEFVGAENEIHSANAASNIFVNAQSAASLTVRFGGLSLVDYQIAIKSYKPNTFIAKWTATDNPAVALNGAAWVPMAVVGSERPQCRLLVDAVAVIPASADHMSATVYADGTEMAGPDYYVNTNANVMIAYTTEAGWFFSDGTTVKTNAMTASANPTVDETQFTIGQAPTFVAMDLGAKTDAMPYLDQTYCITTNGTGDVAASPFKDWNVTIYASFDKDVAGNTLKLASQFGTYDWTATILTDNIAAGAETNLLSNVTYADFCKDYKSFNCGVYAYDNSNAGTTMKVAARFTKQDCTPVDVDLTAYTYGQMVKVLPIEGTDRDMTPYVLKTGANEYVITNQPGFAPECIAMTGLAGGETIGLPREVAFVSNVTAATTFQVRNRYGEIIPDGNVFEGCDAEKGVYSTALSTNAVPVVIAVTNSVDSFQIIATSFPKLNYQIFRATNVNESAESWTKLYDVEFKAEGYILDKTDGKTWSEEPGSPAVYHPEAFYKIKVAK